MPKLPDIQDGLFKLILFSHLDILTLDGKPVSFTTKLKLTGKNVIGSIVFPDELAKIHYFLQENTLIFSNFQKEIIIKLALEANNNQKLKVEVAGNY